MKYTRILPTAAVIGCISTLAIPFSYAQSEVAEPTAVQGTVVATQAAAAQGRPASVAVDVAEQNNLPVVVKQNPELVRELEKITVPKIELKNVSSQAALMLVLESLEVGYEFDNAFYAFNPSTASARLGGFGVTPGNQGGLGTSPEIQTLDLPPRNITMRIFNAPLNRALDSLTSAIGIGWLAEKRGGSITIRFIKLRNTVTFSEVINRLNASNGQTIYGTAVTPPNAIYSGVAGSYSVSGSRTMNTSLLPPTLVKLDVRDKPVRESLRTVLEEAKLEFAIDEDVPADLKKTFAFEGIQIGTALSVICQSAGIGWRSEQTPNGSLIRISKRYALPPAQKAEKTEATNPIQ